MSQSPSQYGPATYRDQGGNRQNIKDAGELRHLGQGSVTQLTDKGTGVTLNTRSGIITTDNADILTGAEATFTVTNSKVKVTDVIPVNQVSGGTSGEYEVSVTAIGAGSFDITITNRTAGTLGDVLVINYLILPCEA